MPEASPKPSSPTTSSSRPARRTTKRRAPRRGEREKPDWRESLRFWFWAIIVILVVRAFIVEPYRIPTPSMERTLLVGDFLFVSKLHYGPRTPNTIGIPFTRVYLRGLELPQGRLPGFSSVRRGDVAVFNHPPESGPIERRTPYIKRLMGTPGDKVVLLDKVLYVNDERFPLTRNQMQGWRVEPAEGQVLTPQLIIGAGLELVGQTQHPRPSYVVNATVEQAAALEGLRAVGLVEPHVFEEGQFTQGIYPGGSDFNRDNYGPLLVPGRGTTVDLNGGNWSAYREAITRFEGRTAVRNDDGTFVIDGQPATTYTFEQDYYFALGDNRDNSEDSRFWGLVPHDHMVGKAVLIFFSVDLERRILGILPTPRLRGLQPIR